VNVNLCQQKKKDGKEGVDENMRNLDNKKKPGTLLSGTC
jgi:hypothetical protein